MVEKNNSKKMKYLDERENVEKIIRTELIFAPFLVILPIIVGSFFIYDWYNRDFILNNLDLTGELIIGVIILVGNIVFDIPFLKSLKGFSFYKK
jgi:hypothetical protein